MSKMTDEQIIKALECCIKLNAEPNNFEICKKDCPYKFNCCDREKGISVEKDALDLINRQQHQLDNYSHNVRNMAKDFIDQQKIIQEQRTEIERLSSENAMLQLQKNVFDQKIQSEAIKEFADRLKEKAYLNDGVTGFQDVIVEVNDIDNLVDEMVGEGK